MTTSDAFRPHRRAIHPSARSRSIEPDHRGPRTQRFFGVVVQPQTYRNVAYALLGLPFGVVWFTTLATGAALGMSMLTIALMGIPILLAMWHVVHWFADAERGIANRLLDTNLAPTMVSPSSGNLWQRLRMMTADRQRRRELGFLLARLPIGVTTFAVATTLLVASGAVAYAPIHARISDQPFGNWSMSTRLQDIASSDPWAWLLLPAGAIALVGSLHAINQIAELAARSASAALGRTADHDTMCQPHRTPR